MNTHNTLCGVSGSRTRTLMMMMIQSKMSCRKTIRGQFESTQVTVTKLVFQFVNWLQQLGGLFFCSFCIFFKVGRAFFFFFLQLYTSPDTCQLLRNDCPELGGGAEMRKSFV
jgi:hypothetical protein